MERALNVDVLLAKLKIEGIDVLKTREPGGTNVSEKIRELLVSGGRNDLTPLSELFLNSFLEKEHIDKTN